MGVTICHRAPPCVLCPSVKFNVFVFNPFVDFLPRGSAAFMFMLHIANMSDCVQRVQDWFIGLNVLYIFAAFMFSVHHYGCIHTAVKSDLNLPNFSNIWMTLTFSNLMKDTSKCATEEDRYLIFLNVAVVETASSHLMRLWCLSGASH